MMSIMNKELILLVDDESDMLKLMKMQLVRDGHTVITAGNGSDALRTVKETRPALILLDIMMPGMDGYEVCRRLKENDETASIPIVFVSALGEEQDRTRAFSLGAADYLVKPVKKKALLEAVNKQFNPDLKKTTGVSAEGEANVVFVDAELEDLIPGYLENRSRDVAEITRLLGAGQFDELGRIGHSMKGTGGGYGFDKISEIGKCIEDAAREGDSKGIINLKEGLSEYLAQVKVVIKEEDQE